jgi:hypothetical protein
LTAAPIRRGLLVTGLLVLVFLALLDLLQPGSVLRRAWAGLQPERTTPVQRQLEEMQRTRGLPTRR